MPRQFSSETFQLDLRSSPSQQHLNPSRSSSITTSAERDDQEDGEMERQSVTNEIINKPHKLDLYSIPVFLLEIIVLVGLALSAYYLHFQYQHEPLISGFYCDDISYRQQFTETQLTQFFSKRDTELVVLVLLLAVPISLIIFCELVNSMFGSLKFRQIRALCTCCKLHSITRRTFRFAGAYALGFLLVMISCDVLANSTGRLRPYFAQDCPTAYQACYPSRLPMFQARDLPSTIPSTQAPQSATPEPQAAPPPPPPSPPLQPVVIETTNTTSNQSALVSSIAQPQVMPAANLLTTSLPESSRIRQASSATLQQIFERHWVDLSGVQTIREFCHFVQPESDTFTGASMAMSWPSFPSAVFTFACLFIASYLSFVGTARPFRLITCVLVTALLLLVTIFNVSLVKDHYHHWDDVVAGSALALVVVVFVLLVYLNRFKDSHYYENQKIIKNGSGRSLYIPADRGHVNDAADQQYKTNSSTGVNGLTGIENGDIGASNNDLAMRYFQIPRANYRGAPRPLSSLNQMR